MRYYGIGGKNDSFEASVPWFKYENFIFCLCDL